MSVFFMTIRKLRVRRSALSVAAFACLSSTSLGLLLASHGVQAQTASLGETVVSASRTEQRVQDALPATTLISRSDIERAQTPDLPTLLKRVTGVQITQNGGQGTVSSAFIRGAESRHTLVLVDGVPVNNLNFSTAALEHLPLANVDRIEVVRGNVSALYGSAALGGVIQIFTRDSAGSPRAGVMVQAGSNGLADMQAGAGVKLASGTRLSADVEVLRNKGFNAIDQTERPGTNPDRDGYSRRSLSAGISQDISAGRLGLTVRESRGTTAYDNQFGPAGQADESKFVLQGAALNGQFRLSSDLTLDASVASSADKLNAALTAFPFFVNSFGTSASTGLTWKLRPGQSLTAGLEGTRQRIESDTVYNQSSRRVTSSRVGYQGEYERHSVQINLRHDSYSDFGSANTWYVGYGLRFTPAWRMSASASTGFNAPTFNDLYFPFGGNAALRPERVKSAELALQYVEGSHDFRLTLFDSRFRDLIANNAFFVRVNVDSARNQGAELSWTGRFGATTARAGFTAQDPTDRTTDKRLARRAASLANLGVSHEIGPWGLGADLRYSGARPDGANTLGAYSVLDVTTSYRINAQWRAFGRIDNLTDKRYETVYGYNQPRRGVFVGLSWQPAL